MQRRGPHEKIIDDNQICAIELLASIAGKLLQESGSSSASSNASENNYSNLIIGKGVIKHENQDEDKLIKAEPSDSVSGEESVSVPGQVLVEDGIGGSDDVKPTVCEGKNQRQSCNINYGREMNDVERMERRNHFGRRHGMMSSVECHLSSSAQMVLDSRPRVNTKLGCRDDDKNFSDYNRLCNKFKASRHPENIGVCRIRKSVTFKHWKTSSKFRDYEPTKTCKLILTLASFLLPFK